MSAAGVGTLKFIDVLMNHWVHIDILKRTFIFYNAE